LPLWGLPLNPFIFIITNTYFKNNSKSSDIKLVPASASKCQWHFVALLARFFQSATKCQQVPAALLALTGTKWHFVALFSTRVPCFLIKINKNFNERWNLLALAGTCWHFLAQCHKVPERVHV